MDKSPFLRETELAAGQIAELLEKFVGPGFQPVLPASNLIAAEPISPKVPRRRFGLHLSRLPKRKSVTTLLRYPLVVVLLFLANNLAGEPEAPAIRLEAGEITISGMTPGGDVAVIGAARSYEGGIHHRWDLADSLADSDLDGRVTWPQNLGVPTYSVWVAIDVATGRHATAAGARPADRSMPLPAGKLVRTGTGRAAIDLPAGEYRVLLVRPGVGVLEGQTRSISRGPGLLPSAELPAEQMTPLGPGRLTFADPEVGDLLVVVDLEYSRVLARQLVAGDFGSTEEP